MRTYIPFFPAGAAALLRLVLAGLMLLAGNALAASSLDKITIESPTPSAARLVFDVSGKPVVRIAGNYRESGRFIVFFETTGVKAKMPTAVAGWLRPEKIETVKPGVFALSFRVENRELLKRLNDVSYTLAGAANGQARVVVDVFDSKVGAPARVAAREPQKAEKPETAPAVVAPVYDIRLKPGIADPVTMRLLKEGELGRCAPNECWYFSVTRSAEGKYALHSVKNHNPDTDRDVIVLREDGVFFPYFPAVATTGLDVSVSCAKSAVDGSSIYLKDPNATPFVCEQSNFMRTAAGKSVAKNVVAGTLTLGMGFVANALGNVQYSRVIDQDEVLKAMKGAAPERCLNWLRRVEDNQTVSLLVSELNVEPLLSSSAAGRVVVKSPDIEVDPTLVEKTLFVLKRKDGAAICGNYTVPEIASRLSVLPARAPFVRTVQTRVEEGLKEYLNVPVVPEPKLPQLPTLVKTEFERQADFTRRIDEERRRHAAETRALQDDFRQRVAARNALLESRVASRDTTADRIAREVVAGVIGALRIKTADYDPEREMMYVTLESTASDFERPVAFRVPVGNGEAEQFKKNLQGVKVSANLDVDRNEIRLADATLTLGNASYVASASEKYVAAKPVTFTLEKPVAMGTGPLQLQRSELLDKQVIKDVSLSYDDDLRKQIDALKASPADNRRWLFVIAVEDYENTADVVYSRNSGESIVRLFQKRMGIPERNTYALIDDKATAGAVKDRLAKMLANVREGDTIYFYYSGHGVPDPKSQEAYLLPKDKMVEYVMSEEYLQLSNIYRQLAASSASGIYVFIDACFSGVTDNVSNFKGVAPGLFRVRDVVVDDPRMVAVVAGTSTQFSNAYMEKGHRMFSYFLMRSLLKTRKGAVDVKAIYEDLYGDVRDASSRLGDAHEQTPQLRGHGNLPFP